MNKKKLSVVMAGAMLATTVAPIMAATTDTEVQASELGLLIGKVRETLLSEKNIKFSNDKRNGADAGQYVYYVKVDGKNVPAITTALNDGKGLQSALQTAIGGLTAGQTVSVWSKGFVQEGNNVYSTTLKTEYAESDMSNATALAITNALASNGNILGDARAAAQETSVGTGVSDPAPAKAQTINPNITVDPGKSITINLNANAGTKGPIVIKPGDKILDFTEYINTKGQTATIEKGAPGAATDFCGFPVMAQEDLSYQDIPDQVVASYKVVGNAPNSFKTSDLFNGVMLTTEGHDLLTKLKEANPTAKTIPNTNVKFTTLSGATIADGNYPLSKSADGSYGFNIAVTDKTSKKATNYTVKGENKNDAQTLLSWLYNENAKVDILAGENRYETAVEVAKEYTNKNKAFSGGTGKIVMVNGSSLVDGLSASPLAAQEQAPMLLVEKDRIPKATADYIRTLAGEAEVGNLSGIEIDIIGGTGVISRNVEKELKSYGFKVVRFGGKDREDTSMKVAKQIKNTKSAFVVGAHGEADAMSIASVASNSTLTTDGITPIIVSSTKGLSDNALETLENKNVVVVGGDAVVSKSEFDNIKEAIGKNNQVTRVAGENRQETNAKVISTYYSKVGFGDNTNVLVAKDGTRNKMELVDALTVSNLAALDNAPIVLATNKLDKAQINALELYAKNAKALYQVGHGVSLDVVKTLATMLGLEK